LKRLAWLAPLLVMAGVLIFAAASRGSDNSASARADRLARSLRCPVCQGLSVADSPSPTARAMAADIEERVKAGESDDEIRAAYLERYGEYVLLSPTATGVGALVWALPVAGLVLGGGGLALAFRRWRRQPALAATDDDRAIVERARENLTT
jgi:cytochrome c-type biogenesis protein CcmH